LIARLFIGQRRGVCRITRTVGIHHSDILMTKKQVSILVGLQSEKNEINITAELVFRNYIEIEKHIFFAFVWNEKQLEVHDR
jgi:hypothetical protein